MGELELGGGSCGTVMRTPQRHCSIPARVSRRHVGRREGRADAAATRALDRFHDRGVSKGGAGSQESQLTVRYRHDVGGCGLARLGLRLRASRLAPVSCFRVHLQTWRGTGFARRSAAMCASPGLTHLVACLARVKAASWEAGHGRGTVRRLQMQTYRWSSFSVSIARLQPTPISPTEPSRSIHSPCRSLWRADHVWSFRLRLYSGARGAGIVFVYDGVTSGCPGCGSWWTWCG